MSSLQFWKTASSTTFVYWPPCYVTKHMKWWRTLLVYSSNGLLAKYLLSCGYCMFFCSLKFLKGSNNRRAIFVVSHTILCLIGGFLRNPIQLARNLVVVLDNVFDETVVLVVDSISARLTPAISYTDRLHLSDSQIWQRGSTNCDFPLFSAHHL